MNHSIYNSCALKILKQISEGTELWWDSNPLVYEDWRNNSANSIPEDIIEFQLTKMWNKKINFESWIFSGVTIDPLLTRTVNDKPNNQWEKIIQSIMRTNPSMGYRQISWEVYKEICKRGAELYMPLYEKSSYKYGFVSVQTDPRSLTNTLDLVKQGLELYALQPNIIVQVPATKAGLHTIFILTALGIPTNATLCFTLPQIIAVAEAVAQGKKTGEKCGMDYSRWCSVITMMIGRFEDARTFGEQASERGIELNEEMKRWAGITVTKKACRILKERNLPSKILVASGKIGPKLNDIQYIWHIEKLVDCNLIFSINTELIKSFRLIYADRLSKNSAIEPVPEEVIEKLLKIPYFVEGYGEDTIRQEDFETIEPTVTANNQFINAVKDFESYVILFSKKER